MVKEFTHELAFETIGNATLVVHDRTPLLATDPWLSGDAYFGSWMLSHAIPEEQLASIKRCEYIWVSHGHPDHLHMPSLETLRDKTILLADHVGGRIARGLIDGGYQVSVLPDRQWVPLSSRVRVMAIADPYQDSILLVDLDGVLVINANDCNDRGWGPTVRREARRSRKPMLLALAGYGDADMINYFDHEGNRIPPKSARRIPPGIGIAQKMRLLGAQSYVPFATMHRYQRDDSVWANDYTTPLDAFAEGFHLPECELLPAFIRFDCTRGSIERLDPPENRIVTKASTDFGDDWNERLSPDEVAEVGAYFDRVDSLHEILDNVIVRVGGIDHEFSLGTDTDRSVRFETPRRSLVNSAKWEIFDDLLIGNFTKTTLLGDWPTHSLRPDFTARLAKYSDNGLARTAADIERYLSEYRRRSRRDFVEYEIRRQYDLVLRRLARSARSRIAAGTPVHRVGRRVYARTRR